MKKMESWKDIDTEPTKTELLKATVFVLVVIPCKIIWFFLRPILIMISAFIPGATTIFFGGSKRKYKPITNYAPKKKIITTENNLAKEVTIGTFEEYDYSD